MYRRHDSEDILEVHLARCPDCQRFVETAIEEGRQFFADVEIVDGPPGIPPNRTMTDEEAAILLRERISKMTPEEIDEILKETPPPPGC